MADAAERGEVAQVRRGASLLKAENVAFVVFLAYLLVYPSTTDEFSIGNTAYFMAISLMALSLDDLGEGRHPQLRPDRVFRHRRVFLWDLHTERNWLRSHLDRDLGGGPGRRDRRGRPRLLHVLRWGQ